MSRKDNLTHHSQALQIGFPLVPAAVITFPELSFGAKLTYTLLCAHAYGEKITSYPSQERLGYFLNRRRETIGEYIRELLEADLIEIISNREGGKKANNIYLLKQVPDIIVEHHRKFFKKQ